jgi:DNA-binding XRE family transcriptional regulator
MDELAVLAGVHKLTIWNLEHGKFKTTVAVKEKLAQAMLDYEPSVQTVASSQIKEIFQKLDKKDRRMQ